MGGAGVFFKLHSHCGVEVVRKSPQKYDACAALSTRKQGKTGAENHARTGREREREKETGREREREKETEREREREKETEREREREREKERQREREKERKRERERERAPKKILNPKPVP